ncbi:hypothetical protein [Natronorubrum aibiense]|uniref:Uncharacterized protein n=1 Tax=Natronorubrum aibiense TaxID=348826 RepID=A0A5P9P329_9EURY|nr:hypothetical protein [Natronorubrum aibiense]QFU82456.1 hypothetical protein GCU68_07945 [Natronorubrum aibiense]
MTGPIDDDEIEIEIERETWSGMDRPAHDGRKPDHQSSTDGTADTTAPERALEDELGRIDLLTTPDGYVEGRVTGLESIDERTVQLEVTLPHDDVTVFTLEKPIPWSERFLLARIVEDVGYDAASIGHLVGEPIYLDRIDDEPRADDKEWWATPIRTASDAVVASLLSDRYRLEKNTAPRWRLVDPLERPTEEDERTLERASSVIAAGLVVLGSIIAAGGAVVGATGGLSVSSTVLGFALPGLILVWFGLAVLLGE